MQILTEVTGSVSVCLSVTIDLAKHWTDMVFLYRVLLFMGPGKVNNYFGGRYYHPPKRNHLKKIITTSNTFFMYLFKLFDSSAPTGI